MAEFIYKLSGWIYLLAIVGNSAFFIKTTDTIEIFIGAALNYLFSLALFLNLGIKTVQNWKSLRSLPPTKCITMIYANASPKFLFFGNIPRQNLNDSSLAIFVCFSFLIPFLIYWKSVFPLEASRLPVFLVLPIFIHIQLSAAFEFITENALKRN